MTVLIAGQHNLGAGGGENPRQPLSYVKRVRRFRESVIGGRTRGVTDFVETNPVVLIDLTGMGGVSDVVSGIDQDRVATKRAMASRGEHLGLRPTRRPRGRGALNT